MLLLFLKVYEVDLLRKTVFQSDHEKFVLFDEISRDCASAINRHRAEMGVGPREAVTSYS